MKTKLKVMKMVIFALSVLLIAITTYSVYDYISENKGEHTIELITNSTNELENIFVKKSKKVSHIDTPTKEGYNFLGWYMDSGYEVPFDKNKSIEKDIKIYAKWEIKQYYVMFDTVGGSAINPYILSHGMDFYGTDVIPTKPGFVFSGWFFDQEYLEPFVSLVVKEHLTLYAKWENEGVKILFDTDDGSAVDSIKVNTGYVIENLPTTDKYGYDFLGWYIKGEEEKLYLNNFVVNKDVTLYAKWEKTKYTVNFETGIFDLVKESIKLKYLSEINVDPLSYSGYVFKGWYIDSEKTIPFINGYIIKDDITLYAKWEQVIHTVKFITNGGSPVENINVGDLDKITKIPVSIMIGYTFVGWYDDSNLTIPFNKETAISKDHTLYAKWQKNTYKFTYDTGLSKTDFNVLFNDSIPVITPPIKPGYRFIGWFLESGIELDYTKMPSENVIVNAKWEINTYKISFETNGGEPIPQEETKQHGMVFKINEPYSSKPGFKLGGWYTDLNDDTSKWDFKIEHIMTSDLVLYAKWIPNERSIQYYNDLNSYFTEQVFQYQQRLTHPVPQKNGYTFVGWYEGEEPFDLFTMPDRNIKLYAKWEINKYKIIFYDLEIDSLTYEYQGSIEHLNNPERSGFEFKGWYIDDEFKQEFNLTNMPANDIILYAKWQVKSNTLGFETNGGSKVDSIEGKDGESVSEPDNPTKEGHTFIGWYLDKSLQNKYVFDDNSMIVKDGLVLYAKWQIKQYKIEFKHQSYDYLESMVIEFDTIIPELNEPIREGHIFIGWYLDKEYQKKFNLTNMPAEDLVLYAKWEIPYYRIAFESDYQIPTIIAKFNDPIEEPTNPEKSGYTFIGWYEDFELNKEFEFNTMPSKNLMLYAKWEINDYSLKFEVNGGSTISDIKFEFNKELEFDVNSEKEGYTFIGWYLDNNYSQVFNLSSMPAEDVTLYAKWQINQYEIEFIDYNKTTKKMYEYNSIIDKDHDIRTGYTFEGWFLDSSYNDAAPIYMPSNGLVVYAKWTINEYEIKFISNGGTTLDEITGNYGKVLILPTPHKVGHSFVGWYENSQLTKLFNNDKFPAKNVTLYAKWQLNDYKINFISNGPAISDLIYKYGETINTLPSIEKIGYTFIGWYLDNNYSQLFNLDKMPASDIRVYAKWQINSYTISFNSNGGSSISSITRSFDSVINEPTRPTKEGFSFKGWYEDSQLTDGYNFIKMPAKNITLYAKWEINKYKTSFKSNIGIVIPDREYEYDTIIDNLPIIDEIGYIFLGWYKENGDKIGENEKIKTNLTLSAKWEKGEFSIAFNSNGGSEIDTIVKLFNEIVEEPSNPVKDKYKFKGWFKDENLNDSFNFTKMPGYNITLYAKWERIEPVSVTYILNNGDNPINKFYEVSGIGQTIMDLGINREGHTFVGWYEDSEFNHQFSMIVPDYDVNLYAKWKINQYTITFNSNGGSEVSGITKDFASDVTAPADPKKTGYTFIGWYLDNIEYTFTNISANNIELTARWQINQYTITFNSNGGNEVGAITKDYDSDVAAPTNPEKTGYTFVGWYLNGEEYNFTKIAASNIELVAKWNKVPVIEYVTPSNSYYLGSSDYVTLRVDVNDDDIRWVILEFMVKAKQHLITLNPLEASPYTSTLSNVSVSYDKNDQSWIIILQNDLIKSYFTEGKVNLNVKIEDHYSHSVDSVQREFDFTINDAPKIIEVTQAGTINLNHGDGFDYRITVQDDDIVMLRVSLSFYGPIVVYASEANPYGSESNRARLNSQGIYLEYSVGSGNTSSFVVKINYDKAYYASILDNITISSVIEDSIGNQVSDKKVYKIRY